MNPEELKEFKRQAVAAVQRIDQQAGSMERRLDLVEQNLSELRGFLGAIKRTVNWIAAAAGGVITILFPQALESIRELASPRTVPTQIVQPQTQPQPQTIYVPVPQPQPQPDPAIPPQYQPQPQPTRNRP